MSQLKVDSADADGMFGSTRPSYGQFESAPEHELAELVADHRPGDFTMVTNRSWTPIRVPAELRDLAPLVAANDGHLLPNRIHPHDRLALSASFVAVIVDRAGPQVATVRVMDPDRRSARGHEVLILDLAPLTTVDALFVRVRPIPDLAVESLPFEIPEPTWRRVPGLVTFVLDSTGACESIEGPVTALLGWEPTQLIGRLALTVIHPDDHASAGGAFLDLVLQPEVASILRHRLMRTDGSFVWTEATLTSTGDGRFRSDVHDVSTQVELEERLDWQATHDGLTGLVNRRSAIERLERMIERCDSTGTGLGVVFIDLDDFKDVNDNLGHEIGDALLRSIADRLRECIRPADVLARLGGDEFVVLCPDLVNDPATTELASRLLTVASSPAEIAGSPIRLTASVGVTTRPAGDHRNALELIRDADTAMYEAKRNGRNRVEAFDTSIRDRFVQRVQRQADLRQALDAPDDLEVWYHPIRLATDPELIVGVEGLIRWNHPDHGLIMPGQFLPEAAAARLMPAIDRWVLRRIISDFAGLRTAGGQIAELRVGVNLSGATITDVDEVSLLLDDITESGFDPRHLVVEVTETELIDNLDVAVAALLRFREVGALVALDDFGVGYSSISHLRRIPADFLKLDHTFMASVGTDEQATIIFRSIVDMATRLGMWVVAEGIETEEQLACAVDTGCASVQGFLWGPPAPPQKLPFWPLD